MTPKLHGRLLIQQLEDDAASFGGAYDLLKEYFAGFPIETLQPLLRHENQDVRKNAVWIASELGSAAAPLLADVIPLTTVDSPYVIVHALDVVVVCADGVRAADIQWLARALESSDESVRIHAMQLMVNTSRHQLDAFELAMSQGLSIAQGHLIGLRLLTSDESTDWISKKTLALLTDDTPLVRRYGAILAVRIRKHTPVAIQMAVESPDPDVAAFAKGRLKADTNLTSAELKELWEQTKSEHQ